MRSNVTLDPRDIRITNVFGQKSPINIKITKHPKEGRIIHRQNSRNPINNFMLDDLNNGKIAYISTTRNTRDSFDLMICISENKCSGSTTIPVIIEKDNLSPPEIIKNEQLNLINTDYDKITTNLLNVQVSR